MAAILEHDHDPMAGDDGEDRAPLAPRDGAWLPLNDLGNARRLIGYHGRDMLHCDERGWLVYDGKRFDEGGGDAKANLRAQEVSSFIADEAEECGDAARRKSLHSWARKTGDSARISAMLRTAAPHLWVRNDELDADAWLLNCANGALRLSRKGIHHYMHNRRHRCTRITAAPYEPDAPAERFQRFMREVLPDDETCRWVQKWLGYSLTGDIGEQRIAFFEGGGANGKSTLIDLIADALGEYSALAPIRMLLHDDRSNGSGPTPDIARLPGARFVRTSEPQPGARLSEEVIKQITGGEKLLARHLQRPFFEFRPAFKVTVSVNVKPSLVGKDHGIRRRIIIVPFKQRFEPGSDPTLNADLRRELPGVLNWLLDGLRLYFEEGLRELPPEIRQATDEYFAEQDPIGVSMTETCEFIPDAEETMADLYAVHKLWCSQVGEEPRKMTPFGRRLGDMGVSKRKSHGRIVRLGLRIRDEWRPVAANMDET